MAISTLEENKAGKEELGELEGKGCSLGQGKAPFSVYEQR